MNDAYSYVCAGEHVIDDEVYGEPPIEENGTLLCSESACRELVYSHCPDCSEPIPGFINGVRSRRGGGTTGRLSMYGTSRKWRIDCPSCKRPYPWARRHDLVAYHEAYLKSAANPAGPMLHLHEPAAAAYEAALPARQAAAKRAKASARREKWRRRGEWWDRWPNRIKAGAVAAVAVLALVFGKDSLAAVVSDPQPSVTTTTTTAPTTTPSTATTAVSPSTTGP